MTISTNLAQCHVIQVMESGHAEQRRNGDFYVSSAGDGARNPQMPTTLWTTILTARDLQSTDAHAALTKLCEVYWFPLYAFVRRSGYSHHDAQDQTQSFFHHLFVQGDWLQNVQKDRGKFRTFLLCALCNFLSNEFVRKNAQKRGGGEGNFVSCDSEEGDYRLKMLPSQIEDKTTEFDRNWGAALIDRCLSALRSEYARAGKTPLFEALSNYITNPVPDGLYREISKKLEISEGTLRVARHRLVHRFAELLRDEVSQTVCDPKDVESELRDILRVWSTNPQVR